MEPEEVHDTADEPRPASAPSPLAPESTTRTCPSCGEPAEASETFCTSCGVRLSRPTSPRASAARERLHQYAEKDRKRKVSSASRWILVIAIIFAVFGTVFGIMQSREAKEAHVVLQGYEDDEVLPEPIDGKMYTAGELRKQIDFELRMVFAVNYALAAIMLGLWFWSWRAPFPAMVTALCVYLSVIVLNGVIDPPSLGKGLLIKILFIAAMIGGIKTALADRAVKELAARSVRRAPVGRG